MNDLKIGDEELISTTRASELSGYSKDYVGQLCREGKLQCRRMSGHWYVSEISLKKYQADGSSEPTIEGDSVPNGAPKEGIKVGSVRDDTFNHDGVEYIATSRGAELTGYAQDYIGQLARNGEIEARKVGRRWFVGKITLLNHKKHNDGLLAAVQSKASGVHTNHNSSKENGEDRIEIESSNKEVEVNIHSTPEPRELNFNVRYVSESDKPLIPKMPLRGPVKDTYAPGDIDKIPISHIGEHFPPSNEEVITNPTKPNGGASRVSMDDIKVGAKREVVFNPTVVKPKFPMHLVVAIGLLLILVLAGYMYLFGLPEGIFSDLIGTLIPKDIVQSLSDSYGSVLPGADFGYIAK